MNDTAPIRVKTISEYHALRGLPGPKHPLISIVNFDKGFKALDKGFHSFIFDYYSIAVKRGMTGKYKYGQQHYDFDEGVMFFMAPKQVFGIERGEADREPSGWMLMIHPDFLWNTSLATSINRYEFFGYAANEALFLSADEEEKMNQIISNIEQEYHSNIDQFSQHIIISQLETLLNYSDRFYQRQFLTRQKANHQVLQELDKLLEEYFNNERLLEKGLPTVQYISEALHMSPGYLRQLLKTLTGQSTQQHIHDKLINKAKELLSTTRLSVSEIAYELGFEHSQSFSKLFKTKTSMSPLAFRESFN